MLTFGHAAGEPPAAPGTARKPLVQQSNAHDLPKQSRLQEMAGRCSPDRFLSGVQAKHSPAAARKVGHSKQDEWTERDAYDYALKRSAGYLADEERVAIAIFYSLCADPSSSYAAMDENDKERMRWCARAAIAALAGKCEPSR